MYLIKFDKTGKQRIDTKIANFIDADTQAELLKAGYVEINDNDFNKLIGNSGNGANDNGYLYDSTTKTVVDAPAKPEPTADEKTATAKAVVDAKYKPLFDDLAQNMGLAVLSDNTETQSELKQEYKDLQAQYKAEMGAIK